MLKKNISLVRWIARTLGGLFVLFFVGLIAYETYKGRGADFIFYTYYKYSLRLFFGTLSLYTVLVGMIIAWKWECFGAALITGGVVGMCITPPMSGMNVVAPFIMFVAGLFFLCWLVDRKNKVKPEYEQDNR